MDNYLLEKTPIGQGSFGTVFRATKRENNDTYALKIIPIENHSHNGRKEELSSILRECVIQKDLKHDNIIRMIEYFQTESSLVIVSELATGSLYALLEKYKRLDVRTVQKYAIDITSGLYYIHSNGVIHRDLKPQNVLVGTNGQAKLCDFGFAKQLNNTILLVSVKGTPLYMSPEVIGRKPYDVKADLWSFGCILYELLVGSPPFSTNSIFDLTKKIVEEPIIYYEFIAGHCRTFLQGLLEKDPEKRLGWPALLEHPFISNHIDVSGITQKWNSLTQQLTPSQELAKKAQKVYLHQERLRNDAKYHHAAAAAAAAAAVASRTHNHNNLTLGYKHQYPTNPLNPSRITTAGHGFNKPSKNKRNNILNNNNIEAMDPNHGVFHIGNRNGNAFTERREPKNEDEDDSSESSCETLSSSSSEEEEDQSGLGEDEIDLVDPDRETVIGEPFIPVEEVEPSKFDLCDSGVFFRIEDPKPIESEEWVEFLRKTRKEVLQTPTVLGEKHFLNVIVTPLRNPHSSSIVIENIAFLLSLPFPLASSGNDSELTLKLINIYLEGKVLPNLISACLLIVQRRRLTENLKSWKNLESVLTDEDICGLEKCLELIAFLVFADDGFIIQFCDTIGILNGYILLELLIRCWDKKRELAFYTLSILGHVLDKDPRKSFVEIIETLFFNRDYSVNLWDLITQSEGTDDIQAKSLRLLGFLLLHSQGIREQFLCSTSNDYKLWNLLESRKTQKSDLVKLAANFTAKQLRSIGYEGPVEVL